MTTADPATINYVIEQSTKIMNGIELFFDRGDEISIHIFEECMREALNNEH